MAAENIRDLQAWTRHASRALGGRLSLLEFAGDMLQARYLRSFSSAQSARDKWQAALLPQVILATPQIGNDLPQFGHQHIGRRSRCVAAWAACSRSCASSTGCFLPSAIARSTRAMLNLFGTPRLRPFVTGCGFAMGAILH
jgi:hypothetical protein